MLVQRDRRRRLQQLAVDSRQDSDVIVGAGRRAHDAGVLVYGFKKLAYWEETVVCKLQY